MFYTTERSETLTNNANPITPVYLCRRWLCQCRWGTGRGTPLQDATHGGKNVHPQKHIELGKEIPKQEM